MKFVDALRQGDTVTENGMKTNSTSLNAVVDLFFNIGAMRGQDKNRLIANFSKSFNEDPTRSLKILFWARDIRGGAGERQIFRDIVKYLADQKTESIRPLLPLIAEYGRWDDMLTFEDTVLQDDAFAIIEDALSLGDGLCAKWMPRKGKTAAKLRNYMNMTPKQYRKTLVGLTDVVETQMCNGEWDTIQFGKLPSVASARYQKAFGKNAPAAYGEYIEGLVKGTEKINAGAVYPYDVIKSLRSGNGTVAQAQWEALPNYLEGSADMILPVVDVSGSMGASAGGNSNLSCLDVAISLGLYISERNEGPFKDAFLTFSSEPTLEVLNGSLHDRFLQMSRVDWGMSTNIEATFRLILNQAIKNSVSPGDMPGKILILSDMEFDEASKSSGSGWYRRQTSHKWNPTAQELIEKMYSDAGYEVPQIVYWNIQSRGGNVPVAYDKTGTALISGFSPAIMKSVLGAEDMTPVGIMDKTIMSERYEDIKID